MAVSVFLSDAAIFVCKEICWLERCLGLFRWLGGGE